MMTTIISCTPSESSVATAIAQTEAAKPTSTPQPTHTPTPTKPPTKVPTITPLPTQSSAFVSDFASMDAFLTSSGFQGTGASECLMKNTPVRLECEHYAFIFKGEAGQMAEIMHDGETILGFLLVFNSDLSMKYQSENTLAIGLVDLISEGLPFVLSWPDPGHQIRDGDFVLTREIQSPYSVYTYLDVDLAEEVLP